MKILKIILISTLFLGTVYPCTDIHNLDYYDNVELNSSLTSVYEEQGDVDNCSPFCICECCTMPTFVDNFVLVNIIPENTPNKIYYKAVKPNSLIDLIFQPPKALI